MKAYITKHALTAGIQEVDDAEISQHTPTMVLVKSLGLYAYFHGEGTNWHRTRESAVTRAEKMRVARIAYMKKTIKKLESLKF